MASCATTFIASFPIRQKCVHTATSIIAREQACLIKFTMTEGQQQHCRCDPTASRSNHQQHQRQRCQELNISVCNQLLWCGKTACNNHLLVLFFFSCREVLVHHHRLRRRSSLLFLSLSLFCFCFCCACLLPASPTTAHLFEPLELFAHRPSDNGRCMLQAGWA